MSKHWLLESLTVADLEEFEDRICERTYVAGAQILSEGDVGDEAYVVIDGACLLYTSPSPRDRG